MASEVMMQQRRGLQPRREIARGGDDRPMMKGRGRADRVGDAGIDAEARRGDLAG